MVIAEQVYEILAAAREIEAVNPYLNTSPTKLKRDIASESDPNKKRLMKEALSAWRATVPGPFWKSAADELRSVAGALREGEISHGGGAPRLTSAECR